MKKKIGIVILNYNDFETTLSLINNIKNFKCFEKIVVVDNSSTDDSYKELKKYETAKIVILKSKENKGYANGMNLGGKYLLDNYSDINIIFTNSDVIIEKESYIKNMSKLIEKDIVAVGPTIKEKGTLNRGFKKTTPFKEILFNLPLISRYFKTKLLFYKDEYFKDKISYVDCVSGCFFMIDGKIFKDINYFDSNTFLYYEEQILFKKVRNINKKIIVDNNSFIIHNHSVTIDKNINRVRKYKTLKKSQSYYVKEYLNANFISRFFLFLTNKLSLLILRIRLLFSKN